MKWVTSAASRWPRTPWRRFAGSRAISTRAEALYLDALALSRKLGDREMECIVLLNLAMVAVARGDEARAVDPLREVIAIRRGDGSRHRRCRACSRSPRASPRRAASGNAPHGSSAPPSGTCEETDYRRDPADEAYLSSWISKTRAALGDARFALPKPPAVGPPSYDAPRSPPSPMARATGVATVASSPIRDPPRGPRAQPSRDGPRDLPVDDPGIDRTRAWRSSRRASRPYLSELLASSAGAVAPRSHAHDHRPVIWSEASRSTDETEWSRASCSSENWIGRSRVRSCENCVAGSLTMLHVNYASGHGTDQPTIVMSGLDSSYAHRSGRREVPELPARIFGRRRQRRERGPGAAARDACGRQALSQSTIGELSSGISPIRRWAD